MPMAVAHNNVVKRVDELMSFIVLFGVFRLRVGFALFVLGFVCMACIFCETLKSRCPWKDREYGRGTQPKSITQETFVVR